MIEERADHVIVSGSTQICRDRDDNLILETAITGEAQYIVSRDDDVKFDRKVSDFLSQYGISVLTVMKFLNLIE